jgi:hypothetical protein
MRYGEGKNEKVDRSDNEKIKAAENISSKLEL